MRSILFAILFVTGLLSTPAWAAPFTLGPFDGELYPIQGIDHSDVFVPIDTTFPGFNYSQIELKTNTPWAVPEVDVAGRRLRIKVNTAKFTQSDYRILITATHGGDVGTVSIAAHFTNLKVSKLLDDPVRSLTYGVQRNGSDGDAHGGLLVIDPRTGRTMKNIRVGKGPSSMALSNDRSELLVLNGDGASISVIDLGTFEVKETISVPMGVGPYSNSAEIVVGAGDIIYYTDKYFKPPLRVFNRRTGQVIQTLEVENQYGVSYYGIGDFVLDGPKKTVIVWSQRGSGNGNDYSDFEAGRFIRYAVSETGTLSRISSPSWTKSTLGISPMLIANDDQNLFFQNLILSPADTSNWTSYLPATIRSISPGGEIAVTNERVYDVETGNSLAMLPLASLSDIQVVSSDYSNLVYFNSATKKIGTLDLIELIGTEALGQVLSPQPEARGPAPTTFSWSSQSEATLYHFYLGDSQTGVEEATPSSPFYRSSSLTPSAAAPGGLTPGHTYYWRVDTVFGSSIAKGVVYSFTVTPVTGMPAPVLSAGPSVTLTDTSLQVTWTDASQETGFVLQYRKASDFGWTTLSPGIEANQTSATLTGLSPETAYEVRLRAINATVNSAWSNAVFLTTKEGPFLVHLEQPFINGDIGPWIRLTFRATKTPTSLIVERALSSGGSWSPIAHPFNYITQVADTNIQVGVTYYYRVTAVKDGLTVYSEIQSVMVDYPTLSLEGLQEVNGVMRMLGKINGYYGQYRMVLQRREDDSSTWWDISASKNLDTHFVDGAILPNKTYHYRLKSVPELPVDSFSNVLTHTTAPLSRPLTPGYLVVSPQTASSFRIHWPDVKRETGYGIERRLASSQSWSFVANLGANVLQYVDTTATPGQRYVYRLTAFNAAGYSAPVESSGPVQAWELPVVMADDFEPSIDPTQWSDVTQLFGGGGAEVRNLQFGSTSSNVLWFRGTVDRVIQTKPLDVSAGGMIEFSFISHSALPDGSMDWLYSESNREVVLEYAVNNGRRVRIATFNIADPAYAGWTPMFFAIPEGARSTNTQFILRQLSHRSAETWAVDDVRIRTEVSVVPLVITTQPTSVIVLSGSVPSSPFTVAVNKPNVTYQWYKDETAIPGATEASYFPANVQAAYAGSYHCHVNDGIIEVYTDTVTLGVIEMKSSPNPLVVARGGSFSLGMDVYPAGLTNGLSFDWQAVEVESLQSVGTVAGASTSTLTVTQATAAAATSYFSKVGYAGQELIVGYYTVQLLSVPQIQPIPATSVITGYWANIPVNIVGATAVRVTGLPAGLRYDSASRHIIGSSTAIQNYTVKVEAENTSGSAQPVTFQLNIIPYPQALAGTYRGVLMQGTEAPYEHGGLISFQIVPGGAASGTVTVRGKVHRLVTVMNLAVADGTAGYLEANYRDAAGNPYVVKVGIAQGVSEVFLSKLTSAGPVQLLKGYVVRNQWTARNPAPGVGSINVALQPDESKARLDNAPLGTGFLNLKLNAGGTVTVKGRLADGKVVTGSTVMGTAGHMPVFTNPYKHTGALTALIHYTASETTGTAYWNKANQGTASKDRLYKTGFVKQTLSVDGGRYVRPSPNEVWQDFPNLAPKSWLTLSDGGLVGAISQEVSFDNKYRALLPRQSAQNPYGLTMKLNVATGVFTGTFKLENENPANANKPLNRTVTYHGSLIPGTERGAGFFLLPELPSSAIPGSTLKNTPIRSGKVVVAPNVVP